MKNRFIVILCICFLVLGTFLGVYARLSYELGISDALSLSIYACYDGCSIATKDSDGFLTNKTWDCWDKCEDYIKEISNDLERSEE